MFRYPIMMFLKFLHFYPNRPNFEVKLPLINRTLKMKMWAKCGHFTADNTLKYVDILQKLVKCYNHSRHRSIGMRGR